MTYNRLVADVPMPSRIAWLPVSERGFPIPWFVAEVNGVRDFRVADMVKMRRATKEHRCWTCGQPLGSRYAFVLGPMCAINRTISEPPSHRDCAVFAALACPFLANPRTQRREGDMSPGWIPPPGDAIQRNHGASAVWCTQDYRRFPDRRGGVLFQPGEPFEVLWFAAGRTATRAEVMASIDSGLPHLQRVAEAEGPDAVEALQACIDRARPYLPAA